MFEFISFVICIFCAFYLPRLLKCVFSSLLVFIFSDFFFDCDFLLSFNFSSSSIFYALISPLFSVITAEILFLMVH